MPNIRTSQIGDIALAGGTASIPHVSQFASIVIEQPNDPVNVSQFVSVVVSGYGEEYVDLDDVIRLGCWTPCGILMQNRSLI